MAGESDGRKVKRFDRGTVEMTENEEKKRVWGQENYKYKSQKSKSTVS